MASRHAAIVLHALGERKARANYAPAPMSEDAIQQQVARHLELLSMPGVVWWHTPNGGSRTRSEAGRFRLQGVKAGIPDILALHNGKLFGLELKADGGRVSPEQKAMLEALGNAGATVAVAFGLDDALNQLRAWGLMRGNARASSVRAAIQKEHTP